MKIPRLRVTQHLTDKIHWLLDLAISIRLPLLTTIVVLTTLLIADM
jgi:hypothetical protein